MNIQSLAKEIPSQGEVVVENTSYITNDDQYLSFCLGNEHYALDILSVKEIRGWEGPTLIPNAPDYVKGVINIRGAIVPIIDLRAAFSVGETIYSAMTVIMVLTDPKSNKLKGFVVDAVSDVLNAEENKLKSAPEFGSAFDAGFIKGLMNVDDTIVTVLEASELLLIEADEEI